MISIPLRISLILGSLLAVLVVARNIKKEKMLIEDAVYWMVAAFTLLLLAIFPNIATTLAAAFGFMSPINFVFLVVIAFLLWKAFSNSAEISRLKAKVSELSQEIALTNLDEHNDATTSSTNKR